MRIDLESRTVQGLITFLSFVGLNVVYLIACVPVVTIGAATSALVEVTYRYTDDERGNLVKDFFPAFARNFPRATVLWLVTGVPALAFAFAAVFWSQHASLLAGAAMVACIFAVAYLLTVFLVAMGLVARYENTLRQTARNAFLLPAAEPIRCFALLLVPLTQVCLALVSPPFWFIIATIGCSVGAYGSAYLYRSLFARHT